MAKDVLITPASGSIELKNDADALKLTIVSETITTADKTLTLPNKTGTLAITTDVPNITGAASTIVSSDLTADRAVISNASGKIAVSATTSAELGYVSGVTSSIQTQFGGTVKTTGDQTIAGTKTFSSTITGSVSGNAGTATQIATTQKSDNVDYQIPFVSSVTAGNQSLYTDSTTGNIKYNPSTNTLTTTTFVGALTGNATNVTGTVAVANGGTGNTSVDTTPTSSSTKMVTSGGVYTALGTKADTTHKYHSFSNGQYFFDTYEQGNNFRLFTETAAFDQFRFQPVSAVEYFDGSNWVTWTGGDASIKLLLDGREETGFYLDHTHRRFRFTVQRSGAWPTLALLVLQETWTGLNHPDTTITIETWSGSAWVVKDTTTFGAGTTGNGLGIHIKATSTVHDGIANTRVTVEMSDWTDSGSYTTIPLRRLMFLSNFNGGVIHPWTWNYNKNVTFPATVTATTFIGALTGAVTGTASGNLGLAAEGAVNVNAANGTKLFVGSTYSWTNRGPATDNSGALLSLNTHPGDYYSQLWFDTGGGNFYHRTSSGVLPTGTWNKVWHEGNDGSGSGLDADTLDGVHKVSDYNRPYNTIPHVASDGTIELGAYIDLHHDNTTGSDFSTRLQTTGNHSNTVYLPSITGTLAVASQLPTIGSGSDFADGTLVTTYLDASASDGPSWTIEVTGKGYGLSPIFFIAEGYNYSDTFINTAGYNYGSANITYIKVLNNGGYLSFWWPRLGYWNSFDVRVTNTTENGIRSNTVTSITNSTEPAATKKVQINLNQVLNTSGSYSDPSWLTISKSKVGLSNVENTALSTWAGSTNLVTAGALSATSLTTGSGTNTWTIDDATLNTLSFKIGGSAKATLTNTGVLTATTFIGALTGTASGNLVSGGALGTPSSGNLSNCTFPTLNQNTTGTAANVTGIVASANGGTGVNNGGRTLTIATNSGTISYTNASTTLTVANTASISGTNTGDQTTITGNAGSATYASAVTTTAENTGTTSRYILFADSVSGNQALKTDTGLTYHPTNNALTATTFIGALSGNADTATSATSAGTATNANNVNIATAIDPASGQVNTYNLLLASSTGNQAVKRRTDVYLEVENDGIDTFTTVFLPNLSVSGAINGTAYLTSSSTASTASAGDNDTSIATTAFVNNEIDYRNGAQVGTDITASTTLSTASSYRNKFIRATHATVAIALTIPSNTYNVADEIHICRYGAADVSFVAGSGVTIYSEGNKLKIYAQYQVATLKCVASNVFVLFGALKS